MLIDQNQTTYPILNQNQYQNPSYQHPPYQHPSYQHLHQKYPQGYSQQPLANPHPHQPNYQYQQGYFVPSSQNGQVPFNLLFQNPQQNQSPIAIEKPKKRKLTLCALQILAPILALGIIFCIIYRYYLNRCQYFNLQSCHYDYYPTLCCWSSSICPVDSQKWESCSELQHVQNWYEFTGTTTLSILIGVCSVLFVAALVGVVLIKRKERKQMKQVQAALYHKI